MGVFIKNANWWIDFRANGRRYRQKVGSSKKLAEQVLCKRLAEVAENRFLNIKKEQKVRFADFAETYLETYAKVNKKSWRSSDANSIRRLKPVFGPKYLHEISPLAVENYKRERVKDVAPATVNRELACLKTIFNKAISWGQTEFNPVQKVIFFKENNARTRYLNPGEIKTLLANSGPKLKAVIILAINTGMRKGEIERLRWIDVDLQKGIACLHETKNGKKRFIPLNDPAKKALLSVPRQTDSPYIFCKRDGNTYNTRKAFETAVTNSKLENFHFHDLRHTFASHMVMAGVDLNTIRELLGHSDLKMTLRYSHLSRDHKAHAVDTLSARLDTIWTPAEVETKQPVSDRIATPDFATH